VLNGTPRSGKSSTAAALQADAVAGTWLILGVDALAAVLPEDVGPGIGLRPGGERPDLEDSVASLYAGLCATVAAWSRAGLNVAVDVGLHDDYSRPLGVLPKMAATLAGLPAYLVGVRCPVEVVMARRDAGAGASAGAGAGAGAGTGGGRYLTSEPGGGVPDAVLRWERAVHRPGLYDLEVDTSTISARECAAAVVRRVRAGPPVAFAAVAARPPD
jgi:chloramphenicol 3-O phosphotransferase